jgi:DHA2 family multidrug resistance protein
LPPTQIATALGLGNFFRIIGGSFGTSISVTMWDRRESFHHSRLVENIYPNNPIAVDTFQQLKAVGITSTERLKLVDDVVTNQAYMLATNDIFWLSGAIFLVLIVVIWFAKPPFFGNKATILTD